MKNTYSLKILTLLCFAVICSFNGISQSDKGITVRLNHKLLNFSKIDDFDLTSGSISEFLSEAGKELLNDPKYSVLSNMKFTKVFGNLRTSDSISISRSGDTVYIPPFWATFNVKPNTGGYSKTIDYLKSCYPLVIYAHPNYSVAFLNVPNDSLFPSQHSLSSTTYPNAHLNVDSAWTIETGKRFIKVGVFDSGIDTNHIDLKTQILTGRGYNWDPYTDSTSWGKDVYGLHGHGTPVAGIIGAKRNNITGVAGIAGGDGSDTTGVSLIDFCLKPGPSAENVSRSIVDAARMVGTYYDWTGALPPVNNEYYWSHAAGYGIHIGNHSYNIDVQNYEQIDTLGSGKDISDSTEVVGPEDIPPIDCMLCREAFLFSMKNGVINVCSSGNGIYPAPHLADYYAGQTFFPQNYDDSWIINVGGSGTDGEWFNEANGLTYETNYFAKASASLDVIAPFTNALIHTTASRNALDSVHEYSSFSGTSGASPHAAGVAALLLSKYNQNCYSNSNLDMADVEYILEHSARDAGSLGYDDFTGYGLIDGYHALKMIDFPEYQIIHPDISPATTTVTDTDTITLFLNRPFFTDARGPIGSSFPLTIGSFHRVVREEIELTYNYGSYLLPSTEILDVWIRPSITNSLGYIADTLTYLNPDNYYITEIDTFKVEPHAEIISVSPSGVITLKGYYYHFIAQYFPQEDLNGSLLVRDYWYPVDPNTTNPRMGFSVYIRDSLAPLYQQICYAPNDMVDSLAGVNEINMNSNDIYIYPNPGTGILKVASPVSKTGFSDIKIYGINGVCIKTITLDPDLETTNFEFDFTDLAAGVYTLIIGTSTNKQYIKKWIKY